MIVRHSYYDMHDVHNYEAKGQPTSIQTIRKCMIIKQQLYLHDVLGIAEVLVVLCMKEFVGKFCALQDCVFPDYQITKF